MVTGPTSAPVVFTEISRTLAVSATPGTPERMMVLTLATPAMPFRVMRNAPDPSLTVSVAVPAFSANPTPVAPTSMTESTPVPVFCMTNRSTAMVLPSVVT